MKPFPRSQSGLSLVEVLVGMTIGLIGIVLINQSQIVFENYKRSTTSAGDAQVNGAIALYTIERELRMAGYGFSHSGALGCSSIQWHYNGTYSSPPGAAAGALPTLSFSPVVITDGASGAPDTITINYSTDADRVIPASIAKTMPNASSVLELDNHAGFAENDLVVIAQGGTCRLAQVTQVMSGAKIQHNPGGSAPYNPSGAGLFSAFSQGAQVFNLGAPKIQIYSIATSTSQRALQLQEMFAVPTGGGAPQYNTTAISLVNDIVDLQAQYGKDNGVDNSTVDNATFTADDKIVDSYDTTTPTTSADWQRVLTVRIGVLARSQNYERPDPPGSACTATTSAPTWSGGSFTVPEGLPSCYKYRVFETVVPLRNMIWRRS